MQPICFPPQILVVVLSLVGQIVLVTAYIFYLGRHYLILAVLLGEVTGLGSDPPVIRACHSFLELDDQ